MKMYPIRPPRETLRGAHDINLGNRLVVSLSSGYSFLVPRVRAPTRNAIGHPVAGRTAVRPQVALARPSKRLPPGHRGGLHRDGGEGVQIRGKDGCKECEQRCAHGESQCSSVGPSSVASWTKLWGTPKCCCVRPSCIGRGQRDCGPSDMCMAWAPGDLVNYSRQFSGWRCVGCGHSVSWTRVLGSGCLTRVPDAPTNVCRLAG